MTLNKSGTAVVINFKYRLLNILGYTMIGGFPIGYIAITRNLFNFENTTTVTGWGIIAIIIASLTLWGKVKETIKDYNTYLGNISQRAKLPIISGTALTIALIVYVSVSLLIGVLGFLTLGGVAAMIPFSMYDKENEKAIRMTEMLKKENATNELEELKVMQTQVKELNAKKRTAKR